MYELKKIGKVFTSKSVWTGPSSYGKRIYRAAVSQRLRNTDQVQRTLYAKLFALPSKGALSAFCLVIKAVFFRG